MLPPPKTATPASIDEQVQSALRWLKSRSSRKAHDGMARYGIPSEHAYGVAMKDIKALDILYAKTLKFYDELGLYISAGQAKLKELDGATIPANYRCYQTRVFP